MIIEPNKAYHVLKNDPRSENFSDRTISSRIVPRSIEFLSRRADFTFIEIPRPRIVCRELQQFSRGEGRDGEILKNLHQVDITFHQTARQTFALKEKKTSIGNPISPPLPPSLSKRFDDPPRRADDTRGIKKRRDYPRAGTRRLIRARAWGRSRGDARPWRSIEGGRSCRVI